MANRLKAWLVKNHLTADSNDYIGVIDSMGSVDMTGVVDALVREGTELKRETVIDVITRYNRKCIDMVLQGYNVGTGLVNMRATIKGALYDRRWNPDKNQLNVSISKGIDLRNAAAETSVEILGEKSEPIALFSVRDISTGNTDGSITAGFNIELKGAYIKVAGDDASCGIYMHSIDEDTDIKLSADCIALNEPSRIMLLIPSDMTSGSYELRITTQYSGNTKPLKQPRTAVLPVALTIG